MATLAEEYERLKAELAELERKILLERLERIEQGLKRKILADLESRVIYCCSLPVAVLSLDLEPLRIALGSVGRSASEAEREYDLLKKSFDWHKERVTIRAEALRDFGRMMAEVNKPFRFDQVEKPKHTGKQNSARNRVICKPAYTAKRK